MGRKFDIADYYYLQKKIALEYGISENQAACHICQYPNEALCGQCGRVETCKAIYDREKKKRSRVYE